MARGTHWWNEPPLWAWIVMVVGAVSLAVLLPIALQRTAPVDVSAAGSPTASGAGDPASPPSAPAETSASGSAAAPSPDGGPLDVVVLGDRDSAGGTAWPALLDAELEDEDVVFEVAAEAGAGYRTAGAGGRTIPELAEDVDLAGADLVVVFGSRNDPPGRSGEVAEAAGSLFERIGTAAPEAELLVIGPPSFTDPGPAGIRDVRDALRSAAAAVEASFVDPVDEGWFADRADLLTATGNPSEAGQRHLAGLIAPEVRALLPG